MSEEAKPEVPATEEQPAATEQPAAEQSKTEDQPAVTEVTEVTSEQPAAAAEGAEKKEGEGEEPKEEEPKPKEPEKKKEPEPKPKVEKPPPDYRTVKAGWIEKPGVIFKSFKRLYMTLDEDGSVLRWWKTEQRTGSDGALYMKYCAEVTEPTEQFTTNWPEGTDERRFVIASPHRAFYILAENAEERVLWIEKLREAMKKYKKEDVKVITTNPMSMESFKASFGKSIDEGEATLQKEGITEKKQEAPKTDGEGEAAATPAAAEEPKKDVEAQPQVEVTVDVQVETTATEEPQKTEGEGEKKEEDKQAEEGGEGEAPKTD